MKRRSDQPGQTSSGRLIASLRKDDQWLPEYDFAERKEYMDCEQKAGLLALYQKRLLSLSRAEDALREARDAKWQTGFMSHWDAANEALTACLSAQNRLESHLAAHQCDEEITHAERRVA